jgi:AraC-like DNA-binding protein
MEEGDVRFHHVDADLRVLEARDCSRSWTLFPDRFSFSAGDQPPAVALRWRYNHRIYSLHPERPSITLQPGELLNTVDRSPPTNFIAVQASEALVRSVAQDLGWSSDDLHVRHPDAQSMAMFVAINKLRARLCTTLFQGGASSARCTCHASASLLYEALPDIVRVLIEEQAVDAREIVLPGAGAAVLRKAKEYLIDNYREPYNLDELARAAGCGKFYLSHLFKREFGVSPSQFQARVLVNYTCHELSKFPDRTLESIARGVGWPGRRGAEGRGDPVPSLIRHFRETWGVTPGQFRAALRARQPTA